METKSRISALMERLNISNEDLKSHKKAYASLSKYGNRKPLDAIPEWQRNKIAEFYQSLRNHGIYDYNPENERFKRSCDYLDAWVYLLQNDTRRPEMESVTREQVKSLIDSGLDDVKRRMGIHKTKQEYTKEIKHISEALPKRLEAK